MAPSSAAHRAALRRCALAVVVLDDLDAEVGDEGVRVGGAAGAPPVPWEDVAAAVAGARGGGAPGAAAGAEEAGAARLRLRDWLLAHRALHAAAEGEPARLLVPLALPAGAARDLGRAWCAQRVLGGALELGAGVALPVAGAAPRVVPLPHPVAARAGVPAGLGAAGRAHLEAMGELAARRLARDAGGRDGAVLRPVGGCDVPTLLAARSLRTALVAEAGGMRAVAVPARERGWLDLARIDPAFVQAAWAATDPASRALPRAALVTRDEVALPPSRIDLAQRVLRLG